MLDLPLHGMKLALPGFQISACFLTSFLKFKVLLYILFVYFYRMLWQLYYVQSYQVMQWVCDSYIHLLQEWVILKSLYHDIQRKNITILLYITMFFSISMTRYYSKKILIWMIFYLKCKTKYGTLPGYKFYPKFDDFYSSLCKKKL